MSRLSSNEEHLIFKGAADSLMSETALIFILPSSDDDNNADDIALHATSSNKDEDEGLIHRE